MKIKELLPGLAMLVIFMGLMIVIALSSRSPTQIDGKNIYAVVFKPGTSLATSVSHISRANGHVMRSGFTENIVIAISGDSEFEKNVYDDDVWFVMDPIYAGGCNPERLAPRAFTQSLEL